MADDTQIPSRDFAADGDLSGILNSIFKKLLQKTEGMLPAVVNSYDARNNVATVKPLIMVLGTEGDTVSRGSYAKVPVLALGGGGFHVRFPLKRGNYGWIEACDRDISLFLQTEKEAKPNSLRLHSFSDSRFVPDVFKKYTFDSDDEGKMVIQNEEGDVKLTLASDGIVMKTNNGAETLSVGAGKISLKAATIEIQDSSGVVISSSGGTVLINGIPFSTHKHTAVQTGPNISGGPTA